MAALGKTAGTAAASRHSSGAVVRAAAAATGNCALAVAAVSLAAGTWRTAGADGSGACRDARRSRCSSRLPTREPEADARRLRGCRRWRGSVAHALVGHRKRARPAGSIQSHRADGGNDPRPCARALLDLNDIASIVPKLRLTERVLQVPSHPMYLVGRWGTLVDR